MFKVVDIVKKLLFALVVLTFLYAPLYPVYAQTPPRATAPIFGDNQLNSTAAARPLTAAERLKTLRGNVATKGGELRAKLQTFKDKQKASLAQKINDSLYQLNKNRSEMMLKRLDGMLDILQRLQGKVDEATTSGTLNSSTQASIDQARVSINNTKALVETQSLKDYTVKVSSESALRSDVLETRNTVHTDLKALETKILESRQAVVTAIQTAIQNLGGAK